MTKDELKNKIVSDIEKLYALGYEDGEIDSLESANMNYEQGLADAWDCARRLSKLSSIDCRDLFHKSYFIDIINSVSVSEALAKLADYERLNGKHDSCKGCIYQCNDSSGRICDLDSCGAYENYTPVSVGDEVIANDHIHVVTGVINDAIIFTINDNGQTGQFDITEATWTGRHFPEVAKVLDLMRRKPE